MIADPPCSLHPHGPPPARVYVNDFQGLGSACLAMPVLMAVEQAAPWLRYSYPENGLRLDPTLSAMLELRGAVGWHPARWRSFERSDWPAIATYLREHRFEAVVNFRNPDLSVDPRMVDFRNWCTERGLRLRWYDYYGWPTETLRGLHVQTRMLSLFAATGICPPPPRAGWLAGRLSPSHDDGAAVGLFSSAASRVKRWPASNWVALGRRLLRSRAESVVVIAGASRLEHGSASELAETLREDAAPARVHLHPPGSLGDLARRLAGLAAIVTNDTGVAHLGDACGIPSVTAFLATDAAIWAPRSPRARHCQSVVGRRCPLQRPRQGNCERHYGTCDGPCREGVTVEDMWTELEACLKGGELARERPHEWSRAR